jgi:hypothetical protein
LNIKRSEIKIKMPPTKFETRFLGETVYSTKFVRMYRKLKFKFIFTILKVINATIASRDSVQPP